MSKFANSTKFDSMVAAVLKRKMHPTFEKIGITGVGGHTFPPTGPLRRVASTSEGLRQS